MLLVSEAVSETPSFGGRVGNRITTQIDTIFEALFRGMHSVSDNDSTDFRSITGTNQPSQTSTAQSSTDSPDVSVSKLYFSNILLLGLFPRLYSRRTAITPSRTKAVVKPGARLVS